VFLYETQDVFIVEDMIHSVAAHVCLREFGSNDLNQSYQWNSVC